MGKHQRQHRGHVSGFDRRVTHQCRAGNGGTHHSEIGAQRSHAILADRYTDLPQDIARTKNGVEPFSRRHYLISQQLLIFRPAIGKVCRIAIESNPAFHHLLALAGIERGHDIHGKRKAIEQLRPQQTFLRVHAAKQDELSGMRRTQALTLNDIHTRWRLRRAEHRQDEQAGG